MIGKVRDVEVDRLFGETKQIKLYLGTKNAQPVILKIAKTVEDNDIITREVSYFNTVKNAVEEVAEMQKRLKQKPTDYGLLFAELKESYMESSQGDRFISIYAIPTCNPTDLVPLSKLHESVEIDVRTSIWILGRLFKIYGFYELMAAMAERTPKYPTFKAEDFLVGPDQHRLIYYNCTSEVLEDVIARDYIKAIAKFFLDWVVVDDDDLAGQDYLELLKEFATNGCDRAEEAHGRLYTLVREKWGIKYYPFTYRDRGTINWQKKEG